MIRQIRLGISNVFLLKGDRPILVDSGRPRDAQVIAEALRREQVALADLALILHTHGHWDHCGSTRQLTEWSKAPTAIHRADADQLARGVNGPLRPTCLSARLLKPFLNWAYPGVTADILLEDETDLAPFGIAGRVISTPGHTAGSVTILTATGAIVGDLLMGGYLGGKLFPRVPNLHYFAEDRVALRASIRKVLHLAPAQIYVGHGGPLDLGAIEPQWVDTV